MASDPSHIEKAKRIAARFSRHWRRLTDEFESAALYGLLLAAMRFDPTAGVPFDIYLSYRVGGECRDLVRLSRPLGFRRGAPAEFDVYSIDTNDSDDHADRYHPSATLDEAAIDAIDAVEVLTAGLPRRNRSIVMRYFIRANGSLKQCGRAIGVTESRACQLMKESLAILREQLTTQGA